MESRKKKEELKGEMDKKNDIAAIKTRTLEKDVNKAKKEIELQKEIKEELEKKMMSEKEMLQKQAKRLSNELEEQRLQTKNLEIEQKEAEQRVQEIKEQMMEKDDECQGKVRKSKADALESERKLRGALEELEVDMERRKYSDARPDQTVLVKGSAVLFERKLAICESEARSEKVKIKCDGKYF